MTTIRSYQSLIVGQLRRAVRERQMLRFGDRLRRLCKMMWDLRYNVLLQPGLLRLIGGERTLDIQWYDDGKALVVHSPLAVSSPAVCSDTVFATWWRPGQDRLDLLAELIVETLELAVSEVGGLSMKSDKRPPHTVKSPDESRLYQLRAAGMHDA
ncbi:MAG: hypothetical protein KC609_22655 [Myxococcales bacterium]|nr:hypothetical protein [Myxococcales bacterium]